MRREGEKGSCPLGDLVSRDSKNRINVDDSSSLWGKSRR
jgi:hypothetical protein